MKTLDHAHAVRGRVIRVGDTVFTPADSSDPAGGRVMLILPAAFEPIGKENDDPLLVIEFNFGDYVAYGTARASKCE